jgi:hypothetical protein
MSIKYLQREVDYLYNLIIKDPNGEGNKYMRKKILDVQPHIGELDTKQLAKDLLIHEDKAPKIGGKRGDPVRAFKDSAKQPLKEFTKELLRAFKNDSRVPSKEGEVVEYGKYRNICMKSTNNKITFVIYGTRPFDEFKRINTELNVQVIKSKDQYKKLFGLENASDKEIASRVGQMQQIGHEEGGAVVNKKIQSLYAGVYGGGYGEDEDLTTEVLIEDLEELGLGSYKGQFETLLEPELTLEHAQKVRIREGQLKDQLLVKISVEGATANQNKANIGLSQGKKSERALGVELAQLVKRFQNDLAKALSNVEKGTRAERSPSPINIVGNMVFSGSRLQKLLRNRKISKKVTSPYRKGIVKNKSPITVSHKETFYGKKPTFSRIAPTASMASRLPRKRKRVSQESGGLSTQEAFITKAFINSRLPKQVQSNMGRPALENRSGRFAQSARIVNASSTGKQAHFDYTYQRNPYGVFENGSEYSANYDPRPLIEKSIRELAVQKLDIKFTLRRV